MAIAEAFSGSEAISTTRWSLTTDTSGPDAETSDGVFQVFLDVSDMVTGDQLEIIIRETVVGGSSVAANFYKAYLYGPQPFPIWVSPTLVLTSGWDFTLEALAGTITVDWSIRAVT